MKDTDPNPRMDFDRFIRRIPIDRVVDITSYSDHNKTVMTDTGPIEHDTDWFSHPVYRHATIVKSRCAYCGQWAPEFDNCPHCGAPYIPVRP